jgi:predicted dehydrogenase
MIKVALVGAGKMGLSHLSILGSHPDVEIVGVCDTSKMVMDVIDKYTSFPIFSDYEKMIDKVQTDAVFISAPTKYHYSMVKNFLNRKINVFAEKPLCLAPHESEELVKLAASNNCINQVGYHNKFVGTFREVKRLVKEGYLGDIYHFVGEAYGPVVVKKKQDTWRSDPSEGGGCLMDYASHVIDLINDILDPIESSKGSFLKPIFSNNVEDSVYSLLELSSKTTGMLSVNWSDDTYRKMSTSITVIGTQGKIISDANELKVFFKGSKFPSGYSKGWNVKYITDLTEQVDFFLRGEEYSAQIDYFIKTCLGKAPNTINTFQSAWQTDNAISIIKNSSK